MTMKAEDFLSWAGRRGLGAGWDAPSAAATGTAPRSRSIQPPAIARPDAGPRGREMEDRLPGARSSFPRRLANQSLFDFFDIRVDTTIFPVAEIGHLVAGVACVAHQIPRRSPPISDAPLAREDAAIRTSVGRSILRRSRRSDCRSSSSVSGRSAI